MTKSEFKAQYSAYRKNIRDSFKLGRAAFMNALDANKSFYRMMQKHDRPVSIKIWLYLDGKGV